MDNTSFQYSATKRLVSRGFAQPIVKYDSYIIESQIIGKCFFYLEPFIRLKHPNGKEFKKEFVSAYDSEKILDWFEELFCDLMEKYDIRRENVMIFYSDPKFG